MSGLDEDSLVVKNRDIASRTIGGKAVLVDPQSGKMLTLNPVGTHIWDALGDSSVGEIAAAIEKDFDVSYDDALRDAVAFLDTLLERGLARLRSPEPT